MEMPQQEGIWIIPAQPLFSQDTARKILGVHGDDAVRITMHRRRENMNVVGIGQPQPRLKPHMHRHTRIGKRGLHHRHFAPRHSLPLRS